MKKIAILASLTILSGCAGTASPTFFAGNYYLAGDSDCRRFQTSTDTRIECFNSKGNFRGYRYAMNSEALRIWQAERAYNDAQIEGLTQSLKQVGQTFEQGGQRVLQQSQGYSPPPSSLLSAASRCHVSPSGGCDHRLLWEDVSPSRANAHRFRRDNMLDRGREYFLRRKVTSCPDEAGSSRSPNLCAAGAAGQERERLEPVSKLLLEPERVRPKTRFQCIVVWQTLSSGKTTPCART